MWGIRRIAVAPGPHRRKGLAAYCLSDYPAYDNWELVYMGVAP